LWKDGWGYLSTSPDHKEYSRIIKGEKLLGLVDME
jgi:hypothetical protein